MAKKPKDDDELQEETPESSIAVNDAWTGMLAVSLLALVVATGFLVWDYSLLSEKNPQDFRATNKPPTAPAKVDPAKAPDPPAKAPDPAPAAKDAAPAAKDAAPAKKDG